MANITIVGSGNSGCAHAVFLSMLGHKVTILKTSNSVHDDNFKEMSEQKGLYYIDEYETNSSVEQFQPLHCVTRDIDLAFENAEFVFVLTQSLQHENIANKICGHCHNIKALIIVPGNLGSVFFRNRIPSSIVIAEGESTIIDARIERPGCVRILFHNVRNALSFNPASDTVNGFAIISGLINNYTHTRTNIIETAMHNPNLIVHTVGTIMSAARIEKSKGEFWMYKEGFTPSIWNIIEALDKEKNQIIEAYEGRPCTYLECCKFRNEQSETIDAKQAFLNYAENGSPKGPFEINNRYLTEDVPNGLCILSSLGKAAGITTPVADSLIILASTLLNRNFFDEARDLNRLGWKDLTMKEIIKTISNPISNDNIQY